MALRRLHQLLLPVGGPSCRFWASAPSVFDHICTFTVIDIDGKHHNLKGLAGKSVAEAMYQSGVFGGNAFTWGPDSVNADLHCYVSNDFLPHLGRPSDQEKTALELCADDQRNNSRMAGYIKLEKGISGLVIALAPNKPWKTP